MYGVIELGAYLGLMVIVSEVILNSIVNNIKF